MTGTSGASGTSGAGGAGGGSGPAADEGWRRLDPRTVWLTAVLTGGAVCGAAVPATVVLGRDIGFGAALSWVLPVAALLILLSPLTGLLHRRSVRYRITDEFVEVRVDVVLSSGRKLRRERLRTVDVTAGPLHRLFGLAELTAGTGQNGEDNKERVKLAPLNRHEAERLRRSLLNQPEPETAVAGPHLLAAIDWSWLRYAPVSFAAPAIGAVVVGLALRIVGRFDLEESALEYVAGVLGDGGIWPAVLALVAAGLAVGMLGSLVWFVEQWWDYRLEREPGGATLLCRRGLFTTRSVSIEQRRLRGVDVAEPLGSRPFGAARVDAVGTGIRTGDDDKKAAGYGTLLPAAPRETADRVAASVLREEAGPLAVPLRAHPAAARRKRVVWAVTAVPALCLTLTLVGAALPGALPSTMWIAVWTVAVVLSPAAVLLGLDAYRSLGHALSGAYVVIRSGTLTRRTVALQRSGVIGWKIRQSVFQRRAGLISVTALTPAGSGAYTVRDTAEADGIGFAGTAVPGLLDQFLAPSDSRPNRPDS
ncbi:PH domain-containing protein [Streptomyces hebeiensis]|uniref:PH domain-containing protein n=1 Tax=Streptomyces hebeiensis TaxID=229486 RepID=A0ABN1ULZ7_9ACTN